MSIRRRHQKEVKAPPYRLAALSLMGALSAGGAWAQDAAAVRTLIEQGQYWQSRGNSERAAEAWDKLLRLNPNQPEALAGLAQAAVDNKRFDDANRYLAQLRRTAASHPAIARIEQAIAVGRSGTQLQTARELARTGRPAEAVANYQSALGSQAPRGPLALEYYQTLGGTAQGWEPARRGLEQLAAESPEDGRIALALAQHLTYRDATRREGIAQLARLAGHPDVGTAAVDAWRRALAWTGSRPSDAPLYRDFLRVRPGDAAVQARLDAIDRQQRESRVAAVASADPLRQRSTAAFKELDDGDLAAAEEGFRSVLAQRPNDADALGGMGVLRLRQENFTEARDYLERATRQGQATRWKQALDSATYWTLVAQATSAREKGNLDGARQLLTQAVKLDPRGEVTAENDLADVLAESGQYDAAEAGYRRVLARQPDNPDAVRGLVGVLAQNNKADEALALIERLSPTQQERVGALGRLRATQALGQAKAAAARGDDTGARVALETALLNDPSNAWVRLDLARLYLKLGATAEARGIMDGLLISNPNMPEALYAHALLSSETQDWPAALATLERIPQANRTRDIAALYKRVWTHVQADAASALAKQGRVQEAVATLAQAEPFAGQDPELLGAIALAYVDAGDANRALATIRELLARTARPEPGLRLQYAAILLKTRQDVELAGILRQLQATPMTAQQRRSYEDIRFAYVVRQADALREAGDLATAYDTIAPLLGERPDDPALIGALARMYAANQDYPQAISLYNKLLEKDPNNIQILLPAATLATSAKEYGYAESAIQVALLRAPQNPEVLTAAGRLYRAQGKTSKATEYFAAAVAAENQQRAVALAASGVAVQARSSNPFANRPFAAAAQQRPAFIPGPVPAMVPVGTGAAWSAQQPAATTAAAFAAPRYVAPAPAAAPAPQPYVPLPAGAARFAAAGPLPQQVPGTAAGGIPAPFGQPAPVAAPPTPASYLPQTYQPAPLPASAGTAGTRTAPAPGSQPAAAPASRSGSSSTTSRRTPAPAPVPTSAAPAAAPAPAAAVASAGNSGGGYGGYDPYAAAAGTNPYSSAVPYPAAVAQGPTYYGQVPVAPVAPSPVPANTPGYVPSGGFNQGYPALSGATPAGAAASRPRTALDDLAEIQSQRIPTFSIGTVARVRQGESGLSQLTDLEAPMQLKFDAGDGRFLIKVTPVSLSAGTAAVEYGTLSRFGGGPATALDLPTRSAGSQQDSGIGVALAYETDRLAVDVGTTPLGFRQTDITGGVKYRLPIGDEFSFAIDLSRRPVTDSLLSFAGARDPRTGQTWGGVSNTGGRIDLNWDVGDFGIYGYGSLHAVTGRNVADNTRVEGGGGLYWRVTRTADSSLTTGLNFTGLGYDKNLRYFTYGHGGYFSPQQFVSLSVPVEWSQRTGRLSYQIKGALGVQHFREDAASYFPTNRALQTAAAQAASDAASFGVVGVTNTTGVYPGQTKTGLGYNLGAALEYQIHPQLFFGGHLALDNARDYRQFNGGLYLRYALQPYQGPQALPVSPVKSPYTN